MNIMSNGITYVYEKSKIQSDIAIWFSKLNQNYVFTISEILFSLWKRYSYALFSRIIL